MLRTTLTLTLALVAFTPFASATNLFGLTEELPPVPEPETPTGSATVAADVGDGPFAQLSLAAADAVQGCIHVEGAEASLSSEGGAQALGTDGASVRAEAEPREGAKATAQLAGYAEAEAQAPGLSAADAGQTILERAFAKLQAVVDRYVDITD